MELVRPADIKTTALLSIEGELDDISGSGQTKAVHEICSGVPESLQRHIDVEGAGHYGIFSGRRWREKVYPQVREFVLQQNASLKKAATSQPVEAPIEAVVAPVAEPVPEAPAAVVAPELVASEISVEPTTPVVAEEAAPVAEPTAPTVAAAAPTPAPQKASRQSGSKKR